MKKNKLFMLIAFTVSLTACSSSDDEEVNQESFAAIDLSDSNVKLSVKPKSELARVKVNIRYESNQNADTHFFDNTRLFVRSVNFLGLSFSDGG